MPPANEDIDEVAPDCNVPFPVFVSSSHVKVYPLEKSATFDPLIATVDTLTAPFSGEQSS